MADLNEKTSNVRQEWDNGTMNSKPGACGPLSNTGHDKLHTCDPFSCRPEARYTASMSRQIWRHHGNTWGTYQSVIRVGTMKTTSACDTTLA